MKNNKNISKKFSNLLNDIFKNLNTTKNAFNSLSNKCKFNFQFKDLNRFNKFNKNNDLNTNDMDSLINHFINNFSKNDSKTIHAYIWKRIIKCVDKLIS